jgi:hypothetical protein
MERRAEMEIKEERTPHPDPAVEAALERVKSAADILVIPTVGSASYDLAYAVFSSRVDELLEARRRYEASIFGLSEGPEA